MTTSKSSRHGGQVQRAAAYEAGGGSGRVFLRARRAREGAEVVARPARGLRKRSWRRARAATARWRMTEDAEAREADAGRRCSGRRGPWVSRRRGREEGERRGGSKGRGAGEE